MRPLTVNTVCRSGQEIACSFAGLNRIALRTFSGRRSGELIMADDLKNRGAQDRARVNVNEDHEVRYWTQKWGVSKEQLAAAVNKVGVSADAVARELGKA
jgi:hypothetical protein